MNAFATSNGEIIEGLQNSASSIAAIGGSVEDAMSLFTGAQEIVQDASKVGNAIRSITMRVRSYSEETDELDSSLANITGEVADLTKTASKPEGVSLFTDASQEHYKSIVEYLGEISDIWDELSEKNQTELLQKLFGKSRANVGAAIITNFDQVRNAIEVMENSAGSADREMSIIQDSMDFKLNAIKETWVGTLQAIADQDSLKSILDGLLAISEALGGIIKAFGLIPTLAGAGGLAAFIAQFD